MITILHGQNTVSSRQYLVDLLAKVRLQGRQVFCLEKSDQTVEKISQVLGGSDLFGADNILLLENYLKLKVSKKPDAFQEYLNQSKAETVIWEEDQRSPTALGLFPQAKVLEFKVSSMVFRFLDNLRPANPKGNVDAFHGSLVGSSAELIFALLSKRIVDLVAPPSTAAPWQKSRLLLQRKLFPLEKLAQAIKDLLTIDLAQKTSSSPLSLEAELEVFLLNL